MKIVKKTMLIITSILLLLVFTACSKIDEQTKDAEYYANNLIKQVEISQNESSVDSDFTVPKTISYENVETTLTWVSSNENVLIFTDSNSNYLAKITQTEKDTKVKFTCYLNYNGEKREKEFSVTILALVEEKPDYNYSFIVDGDYAYDDILNVSVYESNIYNTPLEVALYIVAFNKLPSNFVLKSEFNRNDYTSTNLLSCGGDVFQNREGLLPKDDSYFECDILYTGGSRNAQRIVFSLDTLSVYYTTDHYASFDYIYLYGDSTDSIYVS